MCTVLSLYLSVRLSVLVCCFVYRLLWTVATGHSCCSSNATVHVNPGGAQAPAAQDGTSATSGAGVNASSVDLPTVGTVSSSMPGPAAGGETQYLSRPAADWNPPSGATASTPVDPHPRQSSGMSMCTG